MRVLNWFQRKPHVSFNLTHPDGNVVTITVTGYSDAHVAVVASAIKLRWQPTAAPPSFDIDEVQRIKRAHEEVQRIMQAYNPYSKEYT